MENSRGFQIHNLRGYTLSISTSPRPSSRMEVAILDGETGDFVCLPYDVAGLVPVARLGALIEAVQAHDWEGVCFLCDEDDSDPEGKFPQKVLDLTPAS